MRHPVTALLWQCWRLSRRWYVLIMCIAIVAHLAIMNISPPRNMALSPFRVLMANNAFMLNFTLAIFTTLFAIAVGGRAGFPLRFEFRLPVSPRLLVAVPMLYLSVVCASLYVVPVLLSRLLYDIPFPMAAPAIVLATVVIGLATAGWSTTGSNARMLAVIVAALGLSRVFGRLLQVHIQFQANARGPIDIVALAPEDYALLMLLCLLMFTITAYRVSRQRCSESWHLSTLFGTKSPSVLLAEPPISRKDASFPGSLGDFFAIPCPTSSPWRAEMWLELKRYGIPVLVLGLVCALCLPLLLLAAEWQDWPDVKSLVWLPAVAIFFFGIGIGFLNRRQGSGGYMNAFEGTRAMSTLVLAASQFLTMGLCTLIGMLLTFLALRLALPLIAEPGAVITSMLGIATAFSSASLPVQASGIVTGGVSYLALIALLVLTHACSVFWGRKVLYAMMVFVFYCIAFSSGVSSGKISLATIQQHMWGFAGAMLLLALFALGRVLYGKLLSLRAGITSVAGWLAFLLCAWYFLRSLDINLTNQASELQAFNAALLMLPFTLLLLTVWSYDKLRHR